MTVKELNKFKNKMYHEIIKIPDVANELKYSNVVYVYDISERAKHMVVVFSDERHLHENFI